MKLKLKRLVIIPALISLCIPGSIFAEKGDISFGFPSSAYDARNDARKIAIKFAARGFRIIPVATGNNKTTKIEFDVEVVKGQDYVMFVGIDQATDNTTNGVDMYVVDDIGNMVAQDTRPLRRAAVEFAASYSGIMTIIVDPPKTKVKFRKDTGERVPSTEAAQLCFFALMAGYQPSGY